MLRFYDCTLTVLLSTDLIFFHGLKSDLLRNGRFLLEVEVLANTKNLLEEEITSLRKEVSKMDEVYQGITLTMD